MKWYVWNRKTLLKNFFLFTKLFISGLPDFVGGKTEMPPSRCVPIITNSRAHLLLPPRHCPIAFGLVPFVFRTVAIRAHRPTAPFAPRRWVCSDQLQASQTHRPRDLRRAPDQRPFNKRHLPRGQVHISGHVPADRRVLRHLKHREIRATMSIGWH